MNFNTEVNILAWQVKTQLTSSCLHICTDYIEKMLISKHFKNILFIMQEYEFSNCQALHIHV